MNDETMKISSRGWDTQSIVYYVIKIKSRPIQLCILKGFLQGSERQLELLGNNVTAILPSIGSWSKKSHNRCAYDEIPAYWNEFDVITFLVDLGMYHSSLYDLLDTREKEQEHEFRTDYFKKRFIVSRSIVKHILVKILKAENIADIVLYKKKTGQIMVRGRQDIHLSLSYSGTSIAVAVAKGKIGIDIERVRPVDIRKIRSSPLFDGSKCRNNNERIHHILHVWTLVEAYAKLRDRTPYPLLNSSCLPHDASFVSYCVDQRSIVSLAYDTGNLNNAVFWIDPETFSSTVKNATCSSSISCGDTYVRS